MNGAIYYILQSPPTPRRNQHVKLAFPQGLLLLIPSRKNTFIFVLNTTANLDSFMPI